ncbi:MAG: sodium ion-translocating decarboxylase subunit beta, partial [Clostridia bacterium]|nr:sodium ion-translocating decarboxylase subunit beta [Clostridia bacterium]
MIGIACVLIYLAIGKGFEPLLLLPMAFGMLLANIPGANIMHNEFFVGTGQEEHFVIDYGRILHEGGLFDLLYLGVKLG